MKSSIFNLENERMFKRAISYAKARLKKNLYVSAELQFILNSYLVARGKKPIFLEEKHGSRIDGGGN